MVAERIGDRKIDINWEKGVKYSLSSPKNRAEKLFMRGTTTQERGLGRGYRLKRVRRGLSKMGPRRDRAHI